MLQLQGGAKVRGSKSQYNNAITCKHTWRSKPFIIRGGACSGVGVWMQIYEITFPALYTFFTGSLPSFGFKTSRKKFLGALAPFKTSLYFSRTGASSFSHSIISSQSRIDFPFLNSSASLFVIYTSEEYTTRSVIIHQHKPTLPYQLA